MSRKKSQIEQKDLADDIAKIMGDQFEILKNQLLGIGFNYLLNGNELKPHEWKQKQNFNFKDFKLEVGKTIKLEQKKLLKSVTKAAEMAELQPKQTKILKSEIKKGMAELSSSVINIQNNNVALVQSQVLKSNVADSLHVAISDVITKTNDYGVVTYKNGRNVRWENYMEMKVRTEIQNDIADNMVDTGLKEGIIFYVATYHGDCAPDHAPFQGKIYYTKNWKSVCPKELIDEVGNYISKHNLMTIEDVMGEKGNYFTKRPNCRHYFQFVSIDEVLGVKNTDDLTKLRDEYNLNSKGKYKPEKYQALKEQRYNERKIRNIKGKIEATGKIISSFNGETPSELVLKANSELALLKLKLKDAQKSQRELIKDNPGVLNRNYNKEAYSRMVSDFRIEQPLSLKKTSVRGTINVIELNRHKTTERPNIRPLSQKRFDNLMVKVNKLGGTYIRGTEWATEHLDKNKAGASSIGNILIFRKDVSLSEVLEEVYHLEQNVKFMNDDKELGLRKLLNEIDAKEYLIKVAKRYKIPRYEQEETQKHLKELQQELEEYYKKHKEE